MKTILTTLLALITTCAQAQWLRNGSFEQEASHWALANGASIVAVPSAPQGAHGVRCERNGAVAVQTIIVQPATSYSAAAWLRTENVQPLKGAGYAFAAVQEFDFHGNLVTFRDFAQVSGTRDWQRHTATWTTHSNAFYIEFRCGLFNADGRAWFDAAQFAIGESAPLLPAEPVARRGDLALVLEEGALPANPAAVSVSRLVAALAASGYRIEKVTSVQLADARLLANLLPEAGLLVLPNAPHFPVEAHRNLLLLLTSGADLLTFGGYAFDIPLVRAASGFRPAAAAVPAQPRIANASFEAQGENGVPSGWRRGDAKHCATTTKVARSGQRCVGVRIEAAEGAGSDGWHCDVKATPGETLRLSGWIRTRNVGEPGYAYLAYYPYAGDKWVQPHDIATVRGTSDWQPFSATFTVPGRADRVTVRFGLFNTTGEAFFDDVRLEKVEPMPRINTRHGDPRDGLVVSPFQIGVFDADHPLRRAVRLQSAAPFLGQWECAATEFTGWAASGVLQENARWQPLVNAQDRFGRLRGAAGALMQHHHGPFAGSSWAFFGVDNRDLTEAAGFSDHVLLPLLRHLRRGVSIQRFQSSLACYRRTESLGAELILRHQGPDTFAGSVDFDVEQVPFEGQRGGVVWNQRQTVRLGPGESREVTLRWPAPKLAEGLYRIIARLKADQPGLVDEAETGFVVWDGRTFPRKLNFRFADNYFWLGGKPTFLCGTDTWANWFRSPSQSDPLFWWRQWEKCRDFGVRLPENLQWTPPHYQFSERDWRQLDAAIYLAQEAGVVYMAGLLIGQDVAVDDATLQQQEKFVGEFARRYRDADGLIHYLNGDYQLRPKTPEQRDLRWQVEQTARWNARLAAAIRAADPNHPLTSEYYQRPSGGLDLRLTLDALTVANIGYFDQPDQDLARFPAVFKLTDMRFYGKSLSVGEFGVKTHPAWERERGGSGYHIRRTEAQQNALFTLIPHYTFGLGGSKAQNWCWRDDDDRVFPWGVVHACDDVERDALRVYRAASLLLGRLEPVWRKPEVLLVVSDSSRLQAGGAKAWRAAFTAADTLIHLRTDFAVASDLKLPDGLLAGVKSVFLPGALNVPEAAEAALKRFAQRGGAVYRSGAGGAPAWEWDVTDARATSAEQQSLYRTVLRKAGIAPIHVEPDTPAIHAFRVPLRGGTALVFANASDKPVTFTAQASSLAPVRMTLGAWEPGLVALDDRGNILAVEGSGEIIIGGATVAQANGLCALYSQDDADIRATDRLVLLPARATQIWLRRTEGLRPAVARVGEWRNGHWRTLEELPTVAVRNGFALRVPDDLRGEVVLAGKASER